MIKKLRLAAYASISMIKQHVVKHEKVYLKAIKNKCKPKWYDGILGWAWHCGCSKEHYVDQQCSALVWYK